MVAAIIVCTNWRRCAEQAVKRQEGAGQAAAEADDPATTTSPLSESRFESTAALDASLVPAEDDDEAHQKRRTSIN